jgi:hypothetical protein
MLKDLIETIRKTAQCDVDTGDEGTSCCSLKNPEEVAKAVLIAIFGKDLADMVTEELTFEEIKKRFETKHPSKRLTKI